MYAILDIEGNGAPFRKESIIEIAVYRFDGHHTIDQFISLINPESTIMPYVQKLTGISEKMVKTAPKFHEVAKRIIEITEDAILVGHNVDFDYRMLRQSFHQLGYDFSKDTIDTIPLAKELIPEEESYSLGKLAKSLGIPLTDRHRASGDARATLDLFKILLSKDNQKEILQHQKNAKISNNLTRKMEKLTEFLPGDKGIVYFQDKEGKILYNDYSVNIYQTANKIFHSKNKKWNKLKTQTTAINYEFTGTELIAKLIILQKIKKKIPHPPYGLFFENGKYIIEKTKGKSKSILYFKSFSQGSKVLDFILSNEKFAENPNELAAFLSLKGRNQIWISEGRSIGEHSFLTIEKGKLTGYGYYDLNHQINSLEKINKLKIATSYISDTLYNELKLSLLKNDYTIKQLLP